MQVIADQEAAEVAAAAQQQGSARDNNIDQHNQGQGPHQQQPQQAQHLSTPLPSIRSQPSLIAATPPANALLGSQVAVAGNTHPSQLTPGGLASTPEAAAGVLGVGRGSLGAAGGSLGGSLGVDGGISAGEGGSLGAGSSTPLPANVSVGAGGNGLAPVPANRDSLADAVYATPGQAAVAGTPHAGIGVVHDEFGPLVDQEIMTQLKIQQRQRQQQRRQQLRTAAYGQGSDSEDWMDGGSSDGGRDDNAGDDEDEFDRLLALADAVGKL